MYRNHDLIETLMANPNHRIKAKVFVPNQKKMLTISIEGVDFVTEGEIMLDILVEKSYDFK